MRITPSPENLSFLTLSALGLLGLLGDGAREMLTPRPSAEFWVSREDPGPVLRYTEEVFSGDSETLWTVVVQIPDAAPCRVSTFGPLPQPGTPLYSILPDCSIPPEGGYVVQLNVLGSSYEQLFGHWNFEVEHESS